VRSYARQWKRKSSTLSAQAFLPLSYAPGEAYQLDWSYEIDLINGETTIVKVANVRLCYTGSPAVATSSKSARRAGASKSRT